MQKVLVHKSEAIPDLEEALEEALVRFEEAKRARDQKRKADDLKKELAWSYVASKETVSIIFCNFFRCSTLCTGTAPADDTM